MIGFVLCVFGLAGAWGLGFSLAERLLRPSHRTGAINRSVPLSELLGLGLVLGIGGTAWLLYLWSLCGGTLGRAASLVISLLGFCCGIHAWRQWSRSDRQPISVDPDAALAKICQVIVIVLFVAALAQTLATPMRFWDERATFGLRGAVLFEDGTVWSADLRNPDFVVYHPRYPLLIPVAEQHVYALAGFREDRWAKALFPLLYLGMVLAFAGVLSRAFSRGAAWLWAVVLGTIPALLPHEYGFLCAQADAPVGCFHGLSVLYAWDACRRRTAGEETGPSRRSLLLIAGLLAGLCAFTKDEGLAFLMLDTVLLGMLALVAWWQNRRSSSGEIGGPGLSVVCIYVIAALLVLTPWLVYRRQLPMTTEMNYAGRLSLAGLMQRSGDIGWFFEHLTQRMFREAGEWGWQWWLMLAALLLAPRRLAAKSQWLLIGDVVGAFAALLVAGLLAPTDIHEHIGGSSQRFLMQIAPVAILFAAAQLSPEQSVVTRGE